MHERVILYGLKNCDGCRRARRWFDDAGIEIAFRDIREAPHTAAAVAHVRDANDPLTFVNRRSTTWRQLPAERRETLTAANAPQLLRAHPTLIKRPLLVIGEHVLAGFDEARVRAALRDD